MIRSSLLLVAAGFTVSAMAVILGLPYGRVNYHAFAELYHGPVDTTGLVHIAVDCDPYAPDTQDECTFGAFTQVINVDVTIGNSTPSATTLRAGNFKLTTDETLLRPFPNFNVGAQGNPDVDDGVLASGNCSGPPPNPDTDPSPAVATSFLSCFEMLPAAILPADASHRRFATVHYADVAPGVATASLALSDVALFDDTYAEIASCGPVITVAGLCFDATIYFVEAGGCVGGGGNSDANLISNLPVYAVNDLTRANSDETANCFDTDMDNDGISNFVEFDGLGTPPCASASAATSQIRTDTDGDRFLDGAECLLGSDPANAASMPPAIVGPDADLDGVPNALDPNSADKDSDDDGLMDGIEFRYYNTSMISANTDGDACGDGKEAASFNTDNAVNAGDQLLLVMEILRVPPPAKLRNFDINKDGAVNAGDQLLMIKFFGPCP
ncbi:MAG: hypothetical protein HY873_10625 [Chloroflexi bacterium]|nr:hypothetical protein [Chloroflexota bacterium]